MFTDIVGYTALMGESEEKAVRVRERHRALVNQLVAQFNGEWIEETGDESLSSFPSALDAVSCALAIQAALEDDPELSIRIGIHLGDVIFEGDRVYGDGVNVASRIRPLAEPGGICVSGEVYQSVKNQPGIEASPLGERELKNVDHRVPVFTIRNAPAQGGAGRSPETRASAIARKWVTLVAALALILLFVGGVRWWASSVQMTPPERIRSLAVLPLENLSGDSEQEYFADGMTEALIGDLAQISSLRVISRTSVMQYKGAPKALPEIAKDLKVDAVVEGTVIREGDRVRITAQLIDARDDRHLWAQHYDRDLRNILALQSEVARAVANEIAIQLAPDEQDRLSRVRKVRPETHEAYLKGRYYANRRTVEDLRRAIGYFERAAESDAEYAPAHAGLADAYWLLAVYGARPREVMPSAKAAALRAIELDDTLAEAHASLAAVLLWYEWDFLEAEKGFKRAIELRPSYAPSHQWYSSLLMYLDRSEEGFAEIGRSLEFDPLSLIAHANLGIYYYCDRRYDEATKQLRATLDMGPHFVPAHLWLGYSYAHRSMFDEGMVEFRKATDMDLGRAGIGYTYALRGQKEQALNVAEQLWRRSRKQYVSPTAFVYLYAALGDADQALDWLEIAYDERDPWLLQALTIDPAFDSLRSDPRFQEIGRSVGVPSGGARAQAEGDHAMP
jgi:TolB-like protein/Flp pilus assembly protein TadD